MPVDPRHKKFAIYALAAAGILLATVVGLLVLVRTEPARKWALDRLIAAVAEQGIGLTAGKLDIDPLTLGARATDVTLSAIGKNSQPVARVDAIDVSLALSGVFKVSIPKITIEHPVIHVIVDQAGRSNLPVLKPSDPNSKTPEIGEILVRNATVRYDDAAQQIAARLDDVNGSVRQQDGGRYPIELTTNKLGSLSWRGTEQGIADIRAKFTYSSKLTEIDVFALRAGDWTLSAAGSIADLATLKLTFDAQGTNALLARIGGLPNQVKGTHSAQLNVTGTLASPDVSGKVVLADSWFDNQGPLDGSAQVSWSQQHKRAGLSELALRWGGARIQGGGTLVLDGAGKSRNSVNLRFQNLSSAQLARAADIELPVASVASGSLDLSFPYPTTLESVDGSASVRLAAAAPGRRQVSLSGDAKLNARPGNAELTLLGVRTESASGEGKLFVKGGKQLSGEVKLNAADIDATFAEFRRAGFPLDAVRPGIVKGPVTLIANATGTWQAPQAAFQVASDRLVLSPAPKSPSIGGVLRVDGTASRDRLTIRELRFDEPPKATVQLSGELNNGNLSFSGEVNHTSLRDLLLIATPAGDPAMLPNGPIRATFHAGGTTSNPEVNAAIRSSGLVVLKQPIESLQADLKYAGKTLHIRELTIARGAGSIEGEGLWNSQTNSLNADARIRNFKLDALELPDGAPVRMTLNGDVQSSGTVERPHTKFNIAAAGLSFRDLNARTAAVQGTLNGNQLTAGLDVPDFGAKANVNGPIDSSGRAEVQLELAQAPIEAVLKDYVGRVDASARATFLLNDPLKTMQAGATIQSARLRLPDPKPGELTELRIDSPSVGRFDGKYLDLETVTIIAGAPNAPEAQRSTVMISGRVPVDEKDRSGVVKVRAALDAESLARLAPDLKGASVRGKIDVDLTLTGGGKDWKPEGTLNVSNGDVAHPSLPAPVTGLTAAVEFQNGLAEINDARADWMGGKITAAGKVPFELVLQPNQPASAPFEMTAAFQGLRIESIPAVAEQNVTGETSFSAALSGTVLDPLRWTGRLETSSFRVNAKQGVFEQKSPLVVSLRESLVTLEPFTLNGPESTMALSGSLSLQAPNPLALRVSGNVNAAIAQLFTDQIRADGESKVELAVTGTLDKPRLRGTIELLSLQGEIPAAQAVLENVTGKILLSGQHVEFSDVKGDLNGGSMKLAGTLDLSGRDVGALNARLEAKGTSWSIPEGLETAIDLDLRVAGGAKGYRATGDVRILDGSYRESLVIERGLFRSLSAAGSASAAPSDATRTPVNLEIKVETLNPIMVQNELLNGEVTVNLRVAGNTDRPVVIGRMDVNEGANFYLGGRNYVIDRGAVTFNNQNRIQPTLDVRGHTRASGYDITLQARGTIGEKLETTFTSDPDLSESNIISVLVSGRKLDDLRGRETEVAGNQALSYLTGNLGATLSQRANRALGFNLVRIDPGLIADEADPNARFTLGQDITDRLGLVYSVDLRNSSDQIWVGRFDLTKRFQTRVVRQQDNTVRFQFQHDLKFGGVPPPQAGEKRAALPVESVQVRFEGPEPWPIPADKLKSKLRIKVGKPFDFLKFRNGMDKVKKTLADNRYPEAKIRSTRTEKDGKLVVDLLVIPGPRLEFRLRGAGRATRSKVREAWTRSTFDSLRVRQSIEVIRRELAKDGFPAAKVESFIEQPEPGRKRVVFTVDRGKKFKSIEVRLPGSTGEKEVLATIVPTKDSRIEAAIHPERLKSRVEEFYQRRGYLDTKAGVYRIDSLADSFRINVPVTETPQLLIGEVTPTGNSELTQRQFLDAAKLYKGQYYYAAEVEGARERVDDALAAAGLTGSEVKIEAVRKGNAVDLVFQIAEGRKRVLTEVAVEGNQYVSEKLVRSQIGVKEGDVLTDAKLTEARRNLYAIGAFALVDVDARDVDRATGADRATGVAQARLVARLREIRPFEVRYGVLFDTEGGPGGIFDVSARNILGSARTAGIRGRYDKLLQEARAYFEQPSLLRLPLKFVTTGFLRRELASDFITDRTGGSALLEYRWGKPYLFNFGYRFEQVHTFERSPDPTFPFDIRLRLAPVTAGFSRDTRDDLLDATRGSFMSHIGEWAPSTLGSQLQFAKYFGQYFYYRPLSKPTQVPWSGEMRSRLVYAGGVRYGVASGLAGQDLIPSERFYAGGSTTLRGFVQDRLGDTVGSTAIGGESMFVVNNELRFPLYKFVDGVGFVDAGNVFDRWRDFRLNDLRYTSGFGLRLRTPYFLIRFDYGKILNTRPGDPSGRYYFGIGQVF